MNFNEFINKNFTAENYDIQPFDAAELAWNTCKNEVLKIINETPLGYNTESEHEKLEAFVDLIEDRVKKL